MHIVRMWALWAYMRVWLRGRVPDVLLDARAGPYRPMCALIVWIVHARGMVIGCLLLDVYGVGGFYIVVVVALPLLLALVCFYIGMV